MQDANNDGFLSARKVIDRVLPAEDDAQIQSEMRARGAGKRERRGLTKARLDLGEEFGGDRFGCFLSQVAPDLR